MTTFILTLIRWIACAERIGRTAPSWPLRALIAATLSTLYLVAIVVFIGLGLVWAVPELLASIWSRAKVAGEATVHDFRVLEQIAWNLQVLTEARVAATTEAERAQADAQFMSYVVEQGAALMRPVLEAASQVESDEVQR